MTHFKKILLNSFIGLGILTAAGASFAMSPSQNDSFSSHQEPLYAVSIQRAQGIKPTDIIVTNASSDILNVSLMETDKIHDQLAVNTVDRITAENVLSATLVLKDGTNTKPFFVKKVCSQAIVTVRGDRGAFKINVNSEQC